MTKPKMPDFSKCQDPEFAATEWEYYQNVREDLKSSPFLSLKNLPPSPAARLQMLEQLYWSCTYDENGNEISREPSGLITIEQIKELLKADIEEKE